MVPQAGLVTADDDVLYPKSWLAGLIEAHRRDPDAVVAYRVRRITLTDEGEISPYTSWPFSAAICSPVGNFATGHSGVLYPASMVAAIKAKGDAFLMCAPKADDVWLHHLAHVSGHDVRLVSSNSIAFDSIPFTQRTALKHLNVANRANDHQMQATYGVRGLRDLASDIAGADPTGASG